MLSKNQRRKPHELFAGMKPAIYKDLSRLHDSANPKTLRA